MSILFDCIVKRVTQIVGAIMLMCIVFQIGSRFMATAGLMSRPVQWTDELARGSFVWLCFLGAALAMRQYAHLGIDYFRSKLSKNGQLISDIIVAACVIVFGVLVAYLGYKLLGIVGRQRTPIMRISMQWFYAVVPISGALLAFQGLEFLIHYIVTREPRQLVEEVALPPMDEPLI